MIVKNFKTRHSFKFFFSKCFSNYENYNNLIIILLIYVVLLYDNYYASWELRTIEKLVGKKNHVLDPQDRIKK